MTIPTAENSRSSADVPAYRLGVDLLVLGPVEVRNQGEPVPIGGPKQRSILALLAAEVGHPVSLERIVDEVYGDDAAEGVRRSVRTFISIIRRELGEVVYRTPGGYVLDIDPAAIDSFRFEEEVRRAIPLVGSEPDAASAMLRNALAMWRGHAYADIDNRLSLDAEITRLRELRLAALEARVEADLAMGRHRELTGELEALTVEHPLREKFRAQHMLALYRCGRQTEALRAFGRARSYLADEIGVSPSSELCDLEQQILEQDADLDLPAAPSVTERAVLVVDIAGPEVLMRVGSSARESLTEALSQVEAAVARHGVDSATQRGSAFYAAFVEIVDAISTVEEVMSTVAHGPILPRASIDYGDIEVSDSGDMGGPPVRRSAGIVALSHPGQVLLSAEAHNMLMAAGRSGLVVRSLGSHQIHGVESAQHVFQLILAGQEAEFPPLRLDTNPPPLPIDRRAIPGYELRDPLVTDIAGTTYRAYQPSVGREVEVTVIDPAWADEPEFVSRFEVETQLVGCLQHPHVIPLLDHWRDPSGAYLVSLAVGGETLAGRLAGPGLDVEQRWRLITQIGDALSHAHEAGMVHGALSPHAVVVDDAGNGYLYATGFVMRLVDVPQAASVYMAPETIRGEAATAATDVFGLGRLAADLLGESVRGEPDRRSRFDIVVQQATAQEEADRYPSMGQFLAGLDEGPGRGERSPGPSILRNPYKGLSAFKEFDSADFFGRSESVAELIGMLGEHDLVAVVGPSGSGKSSLVHAGLIPAVRAGALGGSLHWVVADMFPGSYPLEELESALSRVAVDDPGALIDELGSDDRGLARVIKRVLPEGTSLLLVIDQFEELFTLTRDEAARSRLLQAVLNLARDERSDTKVVLTLRADFFDRPLEYHEFGELMKEGTFPLTLPGGDQLREAVKRPAESVGAMWEPGLPEQILEDVAESPGLLPLLQYSLTELFATRRGDQLTHDAYRENGGVLGALATRADEVFNGLDEPRKTLARQLFFRLVSVQPSGEGTRRRARLVEVNSLGDPGDVNAILGEFGDARLLVFDRDPISRIPTVEVAHEALLTRWPRLSRWIEEAGEDLLLQSRLRDGADEWEDRDRDEAYLLTGGRLAQFETWASSTDLTHAPSEIEFLGASREESYLQRSRRRTRRNLITAGFGAAAVIAGIFAFTATRNAAIAESRELAASAINVLDEDPELSVLLALEAAGIADPPIESVSAIHESLAAHHKILTYELPTNREVTDPSATLSPDGDLLEASSGGNYVEVVEVESGEMLWRREFGEGATVGAAFSPDGSGLVATVGWERSDDTPIDPQLNGELGVHRFDARTGALIDHLPIGPCGLVSAPQMVIGPGAGSHLLTDVYGESDCTYDRDIFGFLDRGTMSFLDLSTGEIEVLAEEGWDVYSTPNGSRLAIDGEDGNFESLTRVVDRPSGREVAVLHASPFGISEDGTVVLTDSDDGMATWDVSAGQPDAPMTTMRGFSIISRLSPDGNTVARRNGPVVDLIDSRTGEVEHVLRTGLGSNDDVSFSDDGLRFAVTGDDKVAVFDPTERGDLGLSVKLCDKIFIQSGYVDIAGGTASVFAGCEDDWPTRQFLLDSETLELREIVARQSGRRSALSPDGRFVANQPARVVPYKGEEVYLVSQIVLRDATNGEIVRTMDGMCEWTESEEPGPGSVWGQSCVPFPDTPFPNWPWDLVFSADGSMLAMSGQYTPAVIVWDTRTGEIIGMPSVPRITAPGWVRNAAFSPSGGQLAAVLGRELWMFSTEDWSEVAQYMAPATGDVPADNLIFTPDGQILIGTNLGHFGPGHILFMDGTTLEYLGQISSAHQGGINDLALNEDGSLLASAGVDGVVRVWDVATRSLVHQIPVSPVGDGVGGVGFVGDGDLLVTALENGELRRVTTDTEQVLSIARLRVTRGFTETECTTYRIDPCPTLEEIRGG